MKRINLLLIVLLISSFAMAQGIDSAIFNGLSDGAKREIQALQQKKNIENEVASYSKVAGFGKEIGVAVRDGLTAIKDVTVDLSKTEVGKVTIWLIIWKVAGKDFLQICIGVLFAIISITIVTTSYFKTFKRKICIEKTGFWIFGNKKYELVANDKFWDYPNAAALSHVGILIALIGISAAIMFG